MFNPNITHWVHLGALDVKYSMLAACISQAHIVSDEWLQEIWLAMPELEQPPDMPSVEENEQKAGQFRVENKLGSDPRYFGHCALEIDSKAYWDNEEKRFPEWSDDIAGNVAAAENWKPRLQRKKMFERAYFVSFDQEQTTVDALKSIIERGGGAFGHVSLDGKAEAAVEAELKKAIAKAALKHLSMPTFFLVQNQDVNSIPMRISQRCVF